MCSSIKGFCVAGLSSLGEAGSLSHQTKHLSFTVQLRAYCFDTWEESPQVQGSRCAHQHTLRCLARLGFQESSVLITELGSMDCQGDPGFTVSLPSGELSLRVGALR